MVLSVPVVTSSLGASLSVLFSTLAYEICLFHDRECTARALQKERSIAVRKLQDAIIADIVASREHERECEITKRVAAGILMVAVFSAIVAVNMLSFQQTRRAAVRAQAANDQVQASMAAARAPPAAVEAETAED